MNDTNNGGDDQARQVEAGTVYECAICGRSEEAPAGVSFVAVDMAMTARGWDLGLGGLGVTTDRCPLCRGVALRAP